MIENEKSEFINKSTRWYMENKGYSESDARMAAESQYIEDTQIFQCLDAVMAKSEKT